MADFIESGSLRIDAALFDFVKDEVLPGLGLDPQSFWQGAGSIFDELDPRNQALVQHRADLEEAIDAWHLRHGGQDFDPLAYRDFLADIGYLAPEPAPFTIATPGIDPEVADIAAPQLVVPVSNARFLVNAANARWGSLYDALYGTDAIPGEVPQGPYDHDRGASVIAAVRAFLDKAFPLRAGSWAQIVGLRLAKNANGHRTLDLVGPDQAIWRLSDEAAFIGFAGPGDQPQRIVLRHNGLHVEIVVDRTKAVGVGDDAGIADVLLESALTTIVDFEDSVAVVDAADKVVAYRNWLGLMRRDLTAQVTRAGRSFTRALAADRVFEGPGGEACTLKGRSLLFVRNVGHHMTTPAILLADGREAPEGILDALVTALIGLYDLGCDRAEANSPHRSIYIVKPKMHGPAECSFTNDLFDAVEDLLRLPRHTIKVGLMDEERRTSANLQSCIGVLRNRIAFINTGFLDRTGDEIHTSMLAGAMLPKAEMKESAWIKAYENRNVRIGLACGFKGRAQIGKGMWAAPDAMAAMLAQKVGHPRAGATTAWVPSPTAATLHALHYHEVDVRQVQDSLEHEPIPPLAQLLEIPLAAGRNWDRDEVARELENNAQGILGYVVRWIDQGVGCSKVADINEVDLMEDRATLRISSQHIANWLRHGICSIDEVETVLARMAATVDRQNAGDPVYQPMTADLQASIAFQAARRLIFDGAALTNGYTESVLHDARSRYKQRQT